MKYIFQFGIILAVTFAAELIYHIVPLPVPASIYGLGIMLFLLITKIIKLEWVKESAKYLITIMPLMFIPAGAKLITVVDRVVPIALQVMVVLIVTTVIVMVASGRVTQFIIKREKKDGK